ncbi:hypothetical protein DM01DRAFT_257707 [Hesseltinella vesiculosa]|uniref:Integral membrane protein n=1 Tax=Hesseltinella vesiculosa TaxID=101127 RepID=A0A1X2GJG6_9FUNG|nr:hypothetical protein DM01DRAFT_257707 [Hesseltinella vesiculosa]
MANSGRVPIGYLGAPNWPSLYWPFGPGYDPIEQFRDTSHTLYYIQGLLAFVTLAKTRTLRLYILILIPFIFAIGGAFTTFITGSLLGVAVALVYMTGYFVMTTWIPFLWALINILILVIGGYSTITAIL